MPPATLVFSRRFPLQRIPLRRIEHATFIVDYFQIQWPFQTIQKRLFKTRTSISVIIYIHWDDRRNSHRVDLFTRHRKDGEEEAEDDWWMSPMEVQARILWYQDWIQDSPFVNRGWVSEVGSGPDEVD